MGIRDIAAAAAVPIAPITSEHRPRQRRNTTPKKKKTVYDILLQIKKECGIEKIPDFEINTKKKMLQKIGEEKYAENQYKLDLFLRIYRSKNAFQLFLNYATGDP